MIDFCLNKGSRARVSVRTKGENARMKPIVLHGVLVCFCQLYKYWCPLKERPQLRNCCHGVCGGAVGTSVETYFLVADCGGLNENGFHGLKYLNIWSPVCDLLEKD